jgi:hypothetical protein
MGSQDGSIVFNESLRKKEKNNDEKVMELSNSAEAYEAISENFFELLKASSKSLV